MEEFGEEREKNEMRQIDKMNCWGIFRKMNEKRVDEGIEKNNLSVNEEDYVFYGIN